MDIFGSGLTIEACMYLEACIDHELEQINKLFDSDDRDLRVIEGRMIQAVMFKAELMHMERLLLAKQQRENE